MKYLKLFDLGCDLAWYVMLYHLYSNKVDKIYKAKKSKDKWERYARAIRRRDKYKDKAIMYADKIDAIIG